MLPLHPTPTDLLQLLHRLAALPRETEWMEFKVNNPSEIGEYISALANSAVLCGEPAGYMVWGVENGTHRLVGTRFDFGAERHKGQALENWVATQLNPQVGFRVLEVSDANLRFVILEVPAAQAVVRFAGTAYIRVNEHKKKLNDHGDKEAALFAALDPRNAEDWSRQICPNATLADLDPAAIEKARGEYAKKYPEKSADLAQWDDATFLNKAKVTVEGKITRAALILLGKEEAVHHLPVPPVLTWILMGADGTKKDYRHFHPPFLLATDRLLALIRNHKVRELPGGTLFPQEVDKYDPWVIREALHNCVAHQDYRAGGRVSVMEYEDELAFANSGTFIPGDVEHALAMQGPPARYRNAWLAQQGMVNFRMIDTIGSGIETMFRKQRDRAFPMPDYDFSEQGTVRVRIAGRVLDAQYTRMLLAKTNLPLPDVMALDRIQRHRAIEKAQADRLRAEKLVEGRYPNLHVSAKLADTTNKRAEYIRQRGVDKAFLKKLVLDYLDEFSQATKQDLEGLLLEKMPDVLSKDQKKTKVKNLIQEMRRDQSIAPSQRSGPGGIWQRHETTG